MDIGAKLKELRVLKGLTQEELADRAELSKGFISQVERDLTSPSIATLMDILQCLARPSANFSTMVPTSRLFLEKQTTLMKEDSEYLKRHPLDYPQCPEKFHGAYPADLAGGRLHLSGQPP